MNPKRLEQELRMQSRVVRELAGELQRARCECDRLEAVGASHEQWQKACEVAATLAERYVRAEIELRRLESAKGVVEAATRASVVAWAAAEAAEAAAVVSRVLQARDDLPVTQDNAGEEEEEYEEEDEEEEMEDPADEDETESVSTAFSPPSSVKVVTLPALE